MVNILKPRELLCIDCGKYFMGKTAHYCPECANKRRKLGNKQWKSELNDLEQDNRESGRRLVEYALKLAKAEREQKTQICPNFDKANIKCVTCPAGAWKFKDCGSGK